MTAIAQFGMPVLRVAPIVRERGVTYHAHCPKGEVTMESTEVDLNEVELKAFQDFANDRICRAQFEAIIGSLQL